MTRNKAIFYFYFLFYHYTLLIYKLWLNFLYLKIFLQLFLGRCMSFTYNGAMGNFNNFKTSSECEMFCAKLQCTFGGEFVAVLLSTLTTAYWQELLWRLERVISDVHQILVVFLLLFINCKHLIWKNRLSKHTRVPIWSQCLLSSAT